MIGRVPGKPQAPSFEQIIVTGAAVTSVSFTNLQGDADGGYEIEGYLVPPAGAGNFTLTLRPNGLSTNQAGISQTNSNVLAVAQVTDLRLSTYALSSADDMTFWARMNSRSGRDRVLTCLSRWLGSQHNSEYNQTRWDSAATVITSIDLVSSTSSGIGIGSRFTLRRLGNVLF